LRAEAGICAWAIALVVAGVAMNRHATAAGAVGDVPEAWPAASHLPRSAAGATGVVFVEPECPCSRSTMTELAAAVRARPLTARMVVVFEGKGDGALLATASGIEGVDVIVDDGSEAARFGARTSGMAAVYAQDGALRFHGGLTMARGHEGANVGRAMFVQALQGQVNLAHPVFGCAFEEKP
jgi:hypothetical protein